MKQSFAGQQKAIDDSAEIEARAEGLAIEMKTALQSGEAFHLTTHKGDYSFSTWDVVEQIRKADEKAFLWVIGSICSKRGGASLVLTGLVVEAIDEIVRESKGLLVEAAEFEVKQELAA